KLLEIRQEQPGRIHLVLIRQNVSRSAGYHAASRVVVKAPLTLRQIPAQARESNSASGILNAFQFAQARIDGIPQAGFLGLAVRGRCIKRGPV
ncbi:hypothetical protein ABZ584_37355, partial [Streptomyces antibioticus]|uniref:hypothetical protein n=1 Tax=Streptomyces antibioticus TaxID=1890 RepID=UPI00340CF40F